MSGQASNGQLSLTGSLSNWVLHVGKEPFDIQDLQFQYFKDGSNSSGSVTAHTKLGETDMDARIAFPEPSGRGVVVDLTVQNPKTQFTNEIVINQLSSSSPGIVLLPYPTTLTPSMLLALCREHDLIVWHRNTTQGR